MADKTPISTYKTRLMHYNTTTSNWEMLVPIKSSPALGGAPNKIDVTTFEDDMDTNINGTKTVGDLEFEANYSPEAYDRCAALDGKEELYAVLFGPDGDGSHGKFGWVGMLSVFVNEAAVNDPVAMTVSITNTTPIKKMTDEQYANPTAA